MSGVPPEITPRERILLDGIGRILVTSWSSNARHAAHSCIRHEAFAGHATSRDLKHVPLTGPGMVEGFTVDRQQWAPSLDIPYGLADVSFPSYPGVRMLGRLRDVDLDNLMVGLEVDVAVEAGPGGTKVPAFTPWRG